MTKAKIIAFPGWGCTLEPKKWFGFDMQCHSHLTQMRAFIGEIPIESLIPEEEWILVTWSMGSWMGLELAKIWKNPPKHWFALCPFQSFLGEHAVINQRSFERLLQSFDQEPKRTMQLFTQQQGAFKNWCDSETFRDTDWVLLKKTLHYLGHHPPIIEQSYDIPLTSIIGRQDRLVSERMTNTFSSYFKQHEIHVLEEHNHALFYEEPEKVGLLFNRIVSA